MIKSGLQRIYWSEHKNCRLNIKSTYRVLGALEANSGSFLVKSGVFLLSLFGRFQNCLYKESQCLSNLSYLFQNLHFSLTCPKCKRKMSINSYLKQSFCFEIVQTKCEKKILRTAKPRERNKITDFHTSHIKNLTTLMVSS